jgi:UDP-N-acetylglucosamine 2-epimerase
MKTIKVYTCIFTRSEDGPLKPLLDQMRRRRDFEVVVRNIPSTTPRLNRIPLIEWDLKSIRPDLVLCGFDRPEMVDVAYSAYHMNIPIAQIFAGDISGGAFDDADRFVISTYASLLFCSDESQFKRLQQSFSWRRSVGESLKVFQVGATHFDDMDYDIRAVDTTPYALCLYNPPNKGEILEQVYRDVEYISNKMADWISSDKIKLVYWVAPNGDYGSEEIERMAKSMRSVVFLKNMPRERFLGWMKNAKVLIGNSSCFFYEGCYFAKNVITVGRRNEWREMAEDCKKGASKKIIEHIRNYFEESVK